MRRDAAPTRASLWVATTTVVPSRFSSLNNCISRSAWVSSRLPVGSSASRSDGREMTDRAIATRCCSPPDNSGGRTSCFRARPTQRSISVTSARICPSGRPAIRSGRATLSNAERCDSRRKSWNTTPMRRRRRGRAERAAVPISAPSTLRLPRLGRMSRYISRSTLVLPAPEGPSNQRKAPSGRVKLRSCNTSGPAWPPVDP